MITNKFGFPSAIVNAVTNDPYDSGDCDISVTRLIKPPQEVELIRQATLNNQLGDEDVSDRIWSLLGQTAHTVLERAASDNAVVEQRWFGEALGWTVSGQIDMLEDKILTDFKTTSVWAVKEALQFGKIEWEKQLNVLKWLYDQESHPDDEASIEKLQIVAICRDYRRNEAMRYDDYPPHAAIIPVKMWTDEERQEFVEKKVREHQDAREGNYRPCTDAERWMKPATYAVMKKGRKSALRVLDSQQEAVTWMVDNEPAGTITIEERPGKYTKCEEYCQAAPFCQQHNDV